MKKSELLLMVLQVPLDFVMLLLAGVSAYYLRFSAYFLDWRPVLFDLPLSEFMVYFLLTALGFVVVFAFAGLYSTDPNRKMARELNRVFFACSTGLGLIALYLLFTLSQFDSRFLVAAGWLFAIVFVSFGRILMRAMKGLLYRAGIGLRRVVLVGSGDILDQISEELSRRLGLGYRVVFAVPEFTEAISEQLAKLKLDEIIFINPRANEDEAIAAMEFASDHHLVFKYSADLFSTYAANSIVTPLAGVPIVEVRKTSLDGWGRVIKRFSDIIISIFAIIIFSPFMLLVALGILIETGRPVIYKNERVGIRGRKFFTYKFRSMFQKDCTGPQYGEAGIEAEAREVDLINKQSLKSGPVYKIFDDPRVTRFGRFIRRYSLDELPNFFNVLIGQMSIVGPRPHQPREVGQYEKRHRRVLDIKPGITGLSQISGRSNLSFEEEVKLDIFYIEKWNLFLDFIIIIKTPFVVIRRRGAL